MNQPLAVVGYARYSTDKQTKNSIAYQKEAILNFCKEHSLILDRFYIDEEKTGTNLNRQGMQELIRDAERGEIGAVIVYDISRGSRDVGDWFTLRKQLDVLGVEVFGVEQKLGDLTNPSEFIMELLQIGMAQHEVLQTREKSKAGSIQRAKQGLFMGGIPPLGYDVDDQGNYIINPTEAGWIRTIFEMYVNEASYSEILKAIPEARGKRGRPLSNNSLYSILNNDKYDGTFIWNKRKYKHMNVWAGGKENPDPIIKENRIPAIIDAETMERAKERMADRKHKGRNRAVRDYLLSGLIECEICGANYQARTTVNSKGYESSSYRCANKYNKHKCPAKNIKASEIEGVVINILKEELGNGDFKRKAEGIAEQLNHWTPDLRGEKKELADIEGKIRNSVKAVMDGLVFPELQAELDVLRTRKLELEEIIARAESPFGNVSAEKIEKLFVDALEDLEGGNARKVIIELIPKIIAHADGNVSINVGVCVTGCGGAQYVTGTTFKIKVA